ncbi:MAG: bifunctional adenosylcobinamide kinase/adenosylcobinamide-phosphate guanylyltransferase [Bacillus sp. (in: firmicutes)]
MHVVIGGAYSGKRAFVKSEWKVDQWISAYDGMGMDEKLHGDVVVLEGFEVWVGRLLEEGKTDREIVDLYREWFSELSGRSQVILIMLEIGRGIVPVEEHHRRLRDVVGWVQQEAVKQAAGVTSIWHGLAKAMK